MENWKICHRPILAVYLKILLPVGKNFITENFSLVGLYQKSHLFAALTRSTSDTTNPHENIIPKYFP